MKHRARPRRATWKLKLGARVLGPLHEPGELGLVQAREVFRMVEYDDAQVARGTQHQTELNSEILQIDLGPGSVQNRA